MNKTILITTLAVMLVAGCTQSIIPQSGSLGGGSGLEIISFTAEPSPLFSGSTMRLTMEVENRGGTNVANTASLVYLTGSNFDSWVGTSGKTYNKFDREMKAEDVVRGVPADIKRFSWSFTAPAIPAGQTRKDTFIGRVYHEYSTSALGNVWVYSESEAESARTAGREMYKSSFTYTKGPVGLQVSVSPEPVVLYGAEKSFTLHIKINNLATGTIYYPKSINYASSVAIDPTELNYVNVSVSGGGLTIKDGCRGSQQLIAGRETVLICEVEIGAVESFKSFPLSVNVGYGYHTETSISVTVQGK